MSYNLEQDKDRLILARNQNRIIKGLFDNVFANGFNLDINLSDVNSNQLKDFWLYTAGFLSLLNYENEIYTLSEKSILSILSGEFRLKSLNETEMTQMLADAGLKDKSRGSIVYNLYTIQDGNYSIARTTGYERLKGERGKLKLKTKPISIFTDNQERYGSAADVLKLIRNSLAHSVPFINGTTLTLLLDNDDYIKVSKMWLRGFSETFALLSKKVDEKLVIEKLQKELPLQRNYIDNDKDIDKALSEIKDLFDENTKNNFYRLNNFVKLRVRYEPNFFSKSFDDKVREIAAICANNPNIISSTTETINPAIVYNIQQLIAKELLKRGENAYLTDDDLEVDEIEELNKKIDEINKKSDNFFKNNISIRNKIQQIQLKNFSKGYDILEKRILALEHKIEIRKKLECTNMNICENENLDVLPVEVAANLVFLLAFNNLMTSGFYDSLLTDTDFQNLTAEQKQLFSKFDMSKLDVQFKQKKVKTFTPGNKAFFISCMRNSLAHGLVEYKYPPVKQSEKPTYKDVYLTFNTDAGTTISGKLIDVYNFFSSSGFTSERKPSTITNRRYLAEDDDKKKSDNETSKKGKKPSQPNDD